MGCCFGTPIAQLIGQVAESHTGSFSVNRGQTLSYLIYMQVFFDIAMLLALIGVALAYRKFRRAMDWRGELVQVVDTLGELLLEIERLGGQVQVDTKREEGVSDTAPAPVTPQGELRMPALTPTPYFSVGKADEAAAPSPPPPTAGWTDSIGHLAERGLSTTEIADRLGRPLGEVTLAVGLQRGRVAQA